MSQLDGLARCEECGATVRISYNKRARPLCHDCRPKPKSKQRKPPRPDPGSPRQERARVLRAQGLSPQQIADALGITSSSVRGRLSEARAKGRSTQRGAR